MATSQHTIHSTRCITEKFDIQVDENTRTQATLLQDNIPGYDLPTIDFVQTPRTMMKTFPY